MALTSRIPIQVNHRYSATAEKVSLKHAPPTTARFGQLGPIGTSQGQAPVIVTIQFAVPISGLEFDPRLEFTGDGVITYTLGGVDINLTQCQWQDRSLDNDPQAGSTNNSITVMALTEL